MTANEFRYKHAKLLLLTCLLFWTSSGPCTAPVAAASEQLQTGITTFDSATQKCTAGLKSFYGGLNDFERGIYFDDLVFTPTQRMSEFEQVEDKSQPTGLKELHDKNSLQARLLVIDALSVYAHTLAMLIAPDRAKTLEGQITGTGKSLSAISAKLTALGQNSEQIGKLAGPIATLAGVAGRYFVRGKAEANARAAIQSSAPAVRQLIAELQTDTNNVMVGQYRNPAQQALQKYKSHYNMHMVSLDPAAPIDATRIAIIKCAQTAADRYAHIDAINPSGTLAQLSTAYENLYRWSTAKGNKLEQPDKFIEQMNDYLDDATSVVDALDALHDGRR